MSRARRTTGRSPSRAAGGAPWRASTGGVFRLRPTAADRQVLWFGLLAVGLTWLAWLPLAETSRGWADLHASRYLHVVGGVGPALAALVMTAAYDGRRGLRLLWQRVSSAPGRWLLFAMLAPATAYLVAIGVASAFGVHVDLRRTGASKEFASMPLVGLVGWAASIVTGSVVCTWLFNATGGSIPVLAVFHAALDIFIGSPTGGEVVANVMGASVVLGALTIPRRLGRADLSRSPKVVAVDP